MLVYLFSLQELYACNGHTSHLALAGGAGQDKMLVYLFIVSKSCVHAEGTAYTRTCLLAALVLMMELVKVG